MEYSEFVGSGLTNNTCYETNQKSVTSVVVIDGKEYFKKQLHPLCKNSLRHRMAMYKEFETGQRINSPYIVKYTGINEDEKGLYLLMEHINGMNIAEKIEAEPQYFQNPKHIEKLLRQLLEALQALHKLNVAYLDHKPQNVMLTQISNDVRLTDLGGCFTDSNDYTAEHSKGFAAPELILGNLNDVDARTDIYAIGKMLKYIEEKTNTRLSKKLTKIKERCTREDKSERYESIDDIKKELNSKSRTSWIAITCLLLAVAGYFGWQTFKHTEEYKDMMLQISSDYKKDNIYYTITSEDSGTCKAVGSASHTPNLYLEDDITIEGKTYRVTSIADNAFKGDTTIISIYLPDNMRTLGIKTFKECKNLVTATIPEGITEIPEKCFRGTGISNVKLPSSLKTIGHGAFSRCYNLKNVVVPEGVESIELDAFSDCRHLEHIELPSTLKKIKRGAFWNCSSLQSIDIPASVEEIGEYTFYRCKSLKHVYNHAEKPQQVSVIFKNSKAIIHVPKESLEKYKEAHHWKDQNLVGDL